jgi:hypothetical protein
MADTLFHIGPGFNYNRGYSTWGRYTNGPVDEKLGAVIFRAKSDHSIIGSLIRFTGHTTTLNGQLNLRMEERLGGVCVYLQAGGGTCDANDETDARKNPGVTHGTYYDTTLCLKLAPAIPALTYYAPTIMGATFAIDNCPGITKTIVQVLRLGNLYIPVFTAESPQEQLLYVSARMGNELRVMPMGYANSGLSIYYAWSCSGSFRDHAGVFRTTEAAIRGVNILSHY